ncbi:MAG: diaminopimelate decarboxylase [Deltaproteobacteria bacterium]|nr:diaminopimelate decarboxylase [Deltaproteobacteria bacterium]
MEGFEYRGGELFADQVSVDSIADAVGTPTYIYSAAALRASYRRVVEAFSPLGVQVHYAVKASSNLHLLRLLRGLGAGMDVVSGGELERAWIAGTPMAEIAFAGVGKTDEELRAALDGRYSLLGEDARRLAGRDAVGRGTVGLFNVESESELERLAVLAAELGTKAKVCIRVNPDVDPQTHEYITTGKEENKFGIEVHRVRGLFERFSRRRELDLVGLHVHIGSSVRQVEPYVAATRVLVSLVDELEAAGYPISLLDLGGGWAVDYRDGESLPLQAFGTALAPLLLDRVERGLKILIEPGRSIAANAGLLVTRVQHVKEGRKRRFVICDAGMQTLVRPALYQAFHFIWPTRAKDAQVPTAWTTTPHLPDLRQSNVVGPICESSDFLAKGRPLPEVERGDLLGVFSAGAYGMSMTSNYNDHPRPAEVLVDGSQVTLIGERQPLASLFECERQPRTVDLSALEKAEVSC